MALLKFLKGDYARLSNAAITEGQILVCGDTGELFVDVSADKRVKIGDFITVANLAALEALDATSVPTSRLYYVEDGNILARSNGTSWVQVNKQPTIAELKTQLGLGDLAYKSEVAEANLNADLAAKINAASGAQHTHENKTVLDGITADKVSAWDSAEQNAKDYADDELAKKVDKVDGKSLVSDTEITKLAGVSEGANKVEASETNGSIKIDGVETVVYTHPDKHAIADVDGLQTALDGKQAAGDYAAEEHTHTKDEITDFAHTHTKSEITDFAHTHTVSEITDFDEKVKAYNYATKDEASSYAQDAYNNAEEALREYQESNDAALAGVKATADAAAVKTDVDAALALKADKSVVDAMYTNAKIDELVQGAKDYADANDADTKYGITYDSDSKKIKLVEGGTEAEIDATDFIKDGMIETVALSEDGLNLVITWNTDSDKGANNVTTIPLAGLVDIYTGVSGDRITVSVSSDDKISADLVAGSISKNYLDDGVQTSLAKADSALQSHQDISHLATEADLTLAENRIAALEAIDHDAYVGADTALKNELQGKIDAIDNHAHENKTVLDGITAEKVTAWDAAEQNAKDYADGLADNYAAADHDHVVADITDFESAVATKVESYHYMTVDQHNADADGFNQRIGKTEDRLDDIDALNQAYGSRLDTLEAIDHEAYVAADTALKKELQDEIDADVKALADTVYTKTEVEALLSWGEF